MKKAIAIIDVPDECFEGRNKICLDGTVTMTGDKYKTIADIEDMQLKLLPRPRVENKDGKGYEWNMLLWRLLDNGDDEFYEYKKEVGEAEPTPYNNFFGW